MQCISFRAQVSLAVSCLLTLSTFPCQAQDRAYRKFNTQSVRRTTQKQYPEYTEKIKGIEKNVSDFVFKADDNRVYRVPVIFHILAADGQTTPDEDQVRFQLEVLNKCFGNYEPEKKPYTNESIEKFDQLGASPGIEFYIPASFEGVKGIDVVKTDKKKFGVANEIQNPESGGIAAVNSKKAINIWIGDLDSLNAGYAHLPGAPGELDGIVIAPDFFGNEKGTAKAPYTQGKTLVHLMGTYLGLYELWDENDPCSDDMVADTPPHSGPSIEVSKEANHKYITMCHGYILAMYMNFMDNTDDEMLTLFTPGQKARMRAMLAEGGPRGELTVK
jgi:hypothetical protein